MREKSLWFCALLIAAYLACGAAGEKEGGGPLPAGKGAERIVSLSPSNTEILYALGAGGQVVGVTTYCDWPPEAAKKEKIGNFYSCDIEKIIMLKPDLVLADGSLQSGAISQLRQAGVNVLPVKNENLDEVLDSIRYIAGLVGREREGAALTAQLDKYRREAAGRVAQFARHKRVFIEVWDHPLLTVGNKSYLSDLIRQAGGDNVASLVNRDYYTWDLEKIYAADPDVYLRLRGTDMGSKADKLPAKLMQLRAVKEKKVVTVFGDWIVRPGPRSFAALPELTRAIYPEGAVK